MEAEVREGHLMDDSPQTISLSELLTNLHAVQAGMGAKNTHRSVIRTAMMALIGQAEQIAVLRQGVEAAAAGAIPLVQTTD